MSPGYWQTRHTASRQGKFCNALDWPCACPSPLMLTNPYPTELRSENMPMSPACHRATELQQVSPGLQHGRGSLGVGRTSDLADGTRG